MKFNFGVRMGSGVFFMIWSYPKAEWKGEDHRERFKAYLGPSPLARCCTGRDGVAGRKRGPGSDFPQSTGPRQPKKTFARNVLFCPRIRLGKRNKPGAPNGSI